MTGLEPKGWGGGSGASAESQGCMYSVPPLSPAGRLLLGNLDRMNPREGIPRPLPILPRVLQRGGGATSQGSKQTSHLEGLQTSPNHPPTPKPSDTSGVGMNPFRFSCSAFFGYLVGITPRVHILLIAKICTLGYTNEISSKPCTPEAAQKSRTPRVGVVKKDIGKKNH